LEGELVMPRGKFIEDGIKYTVVLPAKDIEKLKKLAGEKKVSSVNAAVRTAIEDFIRIVDKESYRKLMEEAANDASFIKKVYQMCFFCAIIML
jgi:hypothetical protein